MKSNEEKEVEEKNSHKKYDKSQIFTKIMAGILAILMIVAAGGSLIYALIG